MVKLGALHFHALSIRSAVDGKPEAASFSAAGFRCREAAARLAKKGEALHVENNPPIYFSSRKKSNFDFFLKARNNHEKKRKLRWLCLLKVILKKRQETRRIDITRFASKRYCKQYCVLCEGNVY